MKIQIRNNEHGTSIQVDGMELSHVASEFSLQQEAGHPAELVIKIPAMSGIDVELPDGVVVVEKDATQSR